MNKSEYEKYLMLSSIPIRQLDIKFLPQALASACLIDYKGKRVLLTVQHATGNMGNWAVEVRFEPDMKKIKVYQLGSMNFLRKLDINKKIANDLDFSYVEVPSDFESFFQEISLNGDILQEIPRKVCTISFQQPDKNELFGFAGLVLPDFIEGGDGTICLKTDQKIYTNLKYKEEFGDYYIFELSHDHPGHEHFTGCSGAPIIDKCGNVVALVCGGNEKTNLIYGIALKEYYFLSLGL